MGLKSRFCASCGKDAEKLIDGICIDCLLKGEIISSPSSISLKVCPKCKSIFWRGLWITTDKPLDYYLKQILVPKIKVKSPAEIEDIQIDLTGKESKLHFILGIGDKKINYDTKANITIQKFACPPCSREKKQSYQAIVQIRSVKDPQGLVSGSSKFIKKYSKQILFVKDQPNGIDIYMSEKDTAMNLAKIIKQKFHLKMGTSVKAFSWDKQKNKPHFRTTIILKE